MGTPTTTCRKSSAPLKRQRAPPLLPPLRTCGPPSHLLLLQPRQQPLPSRRTRGRRVELAAVSREHRKIQHLNLNQNRRKKRKKRRRRLQHLLLQHQNQNQKKRNLRRRTQKKKSLT